MLRERLDRTQTRLDSLRRQYSDYLASLEARILRQSALRGEMGRYKALYEEGLIASEVYRDLTSKLENAQDADAPPRFDIGLDTERLIARLDLFATLEAKQLEGALVRTGLTPHNLPADCSNDRADECSTWTNSSKAAISIAK